MVVFCTNYSNRTSQRFNSNSLRMQMNSMVQTVSTLQGRAPWAVLGFP